MSQTVKKGVLQKLVVKNKNPGSVSTGANTEVTLDGVPLRGVSFLKLEFKAAKTAKVIMEMYCDVEVQADINFTSEMPKAQTVKIGERIYTLTEYMAVGIAEDPNA